MNNVVYLMSGTPHCPYVVVSLYTLQQIAEFSGCVRVYCWPDSYSICKQIAADARLGVDMLAVTLREPTYRGKNAQGFDRIKLMQTIPGVSVYIDADSMPVGDLTPLFRAAANRGHVLTQFSGWTLGKPLIHKRVARLLEVEGIDSGLVQSVIDNPDIPAVNCGVFGSVADSPVLRYWEEWTDKAKHSVFIADEVCQNLVYGCEDLDGAYVTLPTEFNCSPKYKPRSVPDNEVVIWHFHGDSNTRLNKSPKGVDMWWPIYQECLDNNIGGIRDWKDECGNRYLTRLERSMELI